MLSNSRIRSHRHNRVPHKAAFGLPYTVKSFFFRVTDNIQPVTQIVRVLQVESIFLGHIEISFLSWLKIDVSDCDLRIRSNSREVSRSHWMFLHK